YRIGGSGNTTANAVVETGDGKGFALTGAVVLNDSFIYAMRIDCDGKPQWASVLDNLAGKDQAIGYDIIEAHGTDARDLVVVGDEQVAASAPVASQGRIARLTAAGAVVWDNAYAYPAQLPGLRFRAVSEALAGSGAASDLVVAGSGARAATWDTDRR